jgi:hypothetical protein
MGPWSFASHLTAYIQTIEACTKTEDIIKSIIPDPYMWENAMTYARRFVISDPASVASQSPQQHLHTRTATLLLPDPVPQKCRNWDIVHRIGAVPYLTASIFSSLPYRRGKPIRMSRFVPLVIFWNRWVIPTGGKLSLKFLRAVQSELLRRRLCFHCEEFRYKPSRDAAVNPVGGVRISEGDDVIFYRFASSPIGKSDEAVNGW